MTVVFFDIDGTLVSMRGAGRAAFQACIQLVFGWEDDLSYIRFAGATDLDVVHQVCQHHQHHPTDLEVAHFFDHLPNALTRALPGFDPLVHAGGPALLDSLSVRETTLVGLVTGNEEKCARLKLGRCNLNHYFSFGAFGHERRHRRDIARLALDRTRERLTTGGAVLSSVYLIGDTPSDIDAARAIGATSIAVTSENHDEKALLEANADHVIQSLHDVQTILDLQDA